MKASPRTGTVRWMSVLAPTLTCALALAACSGSSNGGTGGSGGNRTSTGGSTGGTTAGTGGTPGAGGTTTGTGGSNASTGGTTGSGGSHSGGQGGVNAGTGGSVTGTGGAAGGGSGNCPSGATFCSGFETNALPMGAVYMVNAAPGDWSRDFAVDSSQKSSGNSSLLVKNATATGSSGSAYRMLAVPVPAGPFWVRFYVQSDLPMGGMDHNAFAGPSDSTSPNGVLDAFCEDVGIAFNTTDSDVTWPTSYGRLSGGGTKLYTIPAMTWKCIELSYDLSTRHQQLYVDGTLLIDAANYPPTGSYSGSSFAAFKFGFESFHGPARQIWYDDVVVAPTRIGCH